MGRSPCCPKEGLNRGAWTAMEDKILAEYIKVHGEGKWRNLPERAGLKRCGKSCRLRWLNYLRPDIKRGNITRDEEELIIRLHNLLGNRWSLIAGRLPGRTDNEIKNYWNTSIGKKFQSASHDPAADTTSCPAKPSSSNKLHKLPPLPPPPPPPPPSPNKTTQFSGDQKPSKTCSTTSTPNSRVVRTKATRCTKVVLLPQEDPQKPPVLPLDHHHQHDNSSKPAVDAVVNDIYGQMVAGEGQLDYEPLVPFDESNCSQIMALHDLDFETDDKFLSDFLNIDCLDLELSDCFGNVEGHEYDRVIDDHIDIDSDFHDIIISSSSNTNTNKLGCDETLLFSQDMALFGVELQSDTTVSMIDPRDEMDNWLQN